MAFVFGCFDVPEDYTYELRFLGGFQARYS
jgi:hypothetical protein